jgi:DNA processing protein
MSEISLKHKIALSLIPCIGDISARRLVSYIGSVEGVFSESYRTLVKIPGIGSGMARSIIKRNYLETAEEEVEYIKKNNIQTFFYLDDEYPFRLKQCEDSPVIFYFTGNCNLNESKVLSIVGTRSATPQGKAICEKMISGLASGHPDLVIVSGLAYGIDITAHKSAITNNLATIGVLAHGLKTIYPSIHRSTTRKMINKGGLLTDFLSDILPERNNFLKRNRIIAGLSDATIVIESGLKGGALITADIANSYSRDVYAVPGRPDDQWSAGCNNLIKKNIAALVDKHEDIEEYLNWKPSGTKEPMQRLLFHELGGNEKLIYEKLKQDRELTIDVMCQILDIPVHKLSSILLQMEFNGIVKCFPGNIYRLV